MRDIILILSEIMNQIHDILMVRVGINMTDKQLHFWVIGFIGLVTFLIVFVLVKLIQLLKFHTTILSFIFTFIMMTVFVFAIEIQQAVSNSGNMEFADAIAGLWGFIVFFAVLCCGCWTLVWYVSNGSREENWAQKRKVEKRPFNSNS
ncbi:hypothetical protein LMF32_05060 [Desemzia sp. C1]|uniref:hypothetical protein n=1 Tax=Desemzia sp. C1 TaxID=2892016 RepID=UPI001E2DB642|nr:hypothetical protein [Desemzia sp. C1]MCI3028474.1 hypothetical protein [Desemzia sp. C1]